MILIHELTLIHRKIKYKNGNVKRCQNIEKHHHLFNYIGARGRIRRFFYYLRIQFGWVCFFLVINDKQKSPFLFNPIHMFAHFYTQYTMYMELHAHVHTQNKLFISYIYLFGVK